MSVLIDIISDWASPISKDRNDIVFEERNKSYGAYVIRNEYSKNVNKAAFLAISLFLLGLLSPFIINLIKGQEEVIDVPVVIQKVTKLDQPPPLEDKPIPPQIQAPDLKQVKFTPPVIKPDDQVTEEAPTMEELKTAVVGTQNVEGAEVTIDVKDQVVNTIIEKEDTKPFLIVEQMPEFPGGESEMYKYIYKNYKYPAIARENGIEGKIYIQFVVNATGHVQDVQILRGLHPSCDLEAVRVIKGMPSFKPGKQAGKAVPVQYSIPLSLTLSN